MAPFLQRPDAHLRGMGCKQCGIEKRSKNQIKPEKEVLDLLSNIHGDLLDFSLSKYNGYNVKYIWEKDWKNFQKNKIDILIREI